MESLAAAVGTLAEFTALALQAVAILAIGYGAVEAVFAIVRLVARGRPAGAERREVWLTFARWLTAGLTFQLAADVVETTVAPTTWEQIGRLAAIAVIRTFLTYFLDRDMESMRERERSDIGAVNDHATEPTAAR